MFSIEETKKGTVVIAVHPRHGKQGETVLCSTATLRWRSTPTFILSKELFNTFDEAQNAADKRNGITRK